MQETQSREVEEEDAKRVDSAAQSILEGKVKVAVAILRDMVSRSPKQYVREFMAGDTSYIKFWDVEEFTHFVTDKSNKIENKVVWLSSAYPRAFYYLGFAHVKLNDPASALQFLEAGHRLEPHPLFLIERGKALAQMKRHDLALESYESALAQHSSARALLRAVALRGKGFQLIELGQLDLAEQVFNESLDVDPNNSVAINELRYIAQLRRGGPIAPPQTVAFNSGPIVCAVCGEKLKDGGKVSNVDGRVVWRCDACAAKLPTGPGSPGLPSASSTYDVKVGPPKPSKRAWWHFWKR